MITYVVLDRNSNGISKLNGKLHVFGGYNDHGQDLSSIEVLDEATQMWQTVAPTMTVPRYYQTSLGIFYSSS